MHEYNFVLITLPSANRTVICCLQILSLVKMEGNDVSFVSESPVTLVFSIIYNKVNKKNSRKSSSNECWASSFLIGSKMLVPKAITLLAKNQGQTTSFLFTVKWPNLHDNTERTIEHIEHFWLIHTVKLYSDEAIGKVLGIVYHKSSDNSCHTIFLR